MFRRNVGGFDRAARVLLGALLLPAGLFLLSGHRSYGLAVAIVGLIGLVTGILGFCPPYILFGISTARPPDRLAGGGASTAAAMPRSRGAAEDGNR